MTASWQNSHRILGRLVRVNRNAQLLANHVQLVDRRRTLQVGRHQHRPDVALQQQPSQLAAGRRFARALQAAQHDDRQLAAQVQRRIDRAQQLDQLVVDDSHDLLTRVQRREDALPECLLGHALHEVLDDRVADVRLQQRLLDQTQAVAHVGLGKFSLTAQRLKSRLQSVLEGFEHGPSGRKQGIVAACSLRIGSSHGPPYMGKPRENPHSSEPAPGL